MQRMPCCLCCATQMCKYNRSSIEYEGFTDETTWTINSLNPLNFTIVYDGDTTSTAVRYVYC